MQPEGGALTCAGMREPTASADPGILQQQTSRPAASQRALLMTELTHVCVFADIESSHAISSFNTLDRV